MASGPVARAVRGLNTTAAKIRALAAEGRSRADIARALNIRYQHVRNVLIRDEAKARAAAVSEPEKVPGKATGKVTVAADGSVVVPATAINALSLKQGDPLFVRVAEGEIHLLTRAAVTRRVQSFVRKFVPEGVSLVDELVADRRREVEAEARDG
jgi:bifunctional DNA-binding transcriptional regulator/antitoxin component of YhaV-PrlF toxin-antitoxin module